MSEGSTNQAGRWAAGVGKDSQVVDDSSDKTPLLPKDSPDLDCPSTLAQGTETAKDSCSFDSSPRSKTVEEKGSDSLLKGAKKPDSTPDPQSPPQGSSTAKTRDNTSDPQSPSKRQLTGKAGDKAPVTHSPPKRSPAAGDASRDPDSPSPSAAAKAAEDGSGSGVPATKAKTEGGKDSVTVTEVAKTEEDPHHPDIPTEQAKAASSCRDSPTEGATGGGGLEDSTTDDSETEVKLSPEYKRVLMKYELLRLKQSEWILQTGPGRLDVLHDEHMASHPGKRLHQESEIQRGVVSNLLRNGRWDLIISMKRELLPDAADMVARRAIDEYRIEELMELVPSVNFREGTLINILDEVCLRPGLMSDAHKIIRLLPPTLLPWKVVQTYRALQYWHGGDLDFDQDLLFMKHDVLRELRRHFGIEEDSAGKPFKP